MTSELTQKTNDCSAYQIQVNQLSEKYEKLEAYQAENQK